MSVLESFAFVSVLFVRVNKEKPTFAAQSFRSSLAAILTPIIPSKKKHLIMSSSGDNSDKNVDKSSDEGSGHIVDRDRNMAIFPFSDMSSSDDDSPTTSNKRKEGTPVRGVLETAADPGSAQKRKRAGTTTGETWSMLEELLETQTIIPSQKKKRVSFTELSGTPNRLLSPLPSSRPESQQEFTTPKPSEGKKKRVSFAGISGAPKRPPTPSATTSATSKKRVSTPLRKKPKTPTTTTTVTPKYPKYPKLPPTPTYRGSVPKPSSPEPINESSFHDLTEENSLLRTRVQASEELDDMILATAAPIGAIAFSDASSTNVVDPVRQTLRAIDRPAAEACLVLIDKLTETQAGLAASRTDGMEQFIKFEEADEEARRGKILVERIGLLEESNEVLEAEKDELNRLCLSRHLTAQERGQHIKALAESSKRFKEIQINDRATIANLQKEVDDLKQRETTFAESAEVYIKQLSEKGGITAEPQFNTYSAETKKAAEGLSEVMDMLSGKNYIDAVILDNPVVLAVNLMRGFTADVLGKKNPSSKTPEKPKSQPAESTPVSNIDIIRNLTNIADNDPCRAVKILLRENQANWEKRQLEWDEILRIQNENAADLLGRMTDERDKLRILNDISTEQALAMAKVSADEIKEATGALIRCETERGARIKQLEELRNEVKNLQAAKLKTEMGRIEDLKNQVLNLYETAPPRSRDVVAKELSAQIENLQKTNTAFEKETLAQIGAIANTTVDVSRLENCLEERDALKEEIAILGGEIDTFKREIATLSRQRDDGYEAKRQYCELQKTSSAQIEVLDYRIADLEAEVDRLAALAIETPGAGLDPCADVKRMLLGVQTASGRKDIQIKDLRAEIDKLKSYQSRTTKGGTADAERQFFKPQTASDEKDDEIENLRAEIDRLKGSETVGTAGGGDDPYAEVSRQLLELQGLSDEKDGEIEALRAEMDKLKSSETAGTAGDGVDSFAHIKEQLLKFQALSDKRGRQIRDLRTEILQLESVGISGDGFDLCAGVKAELLELQGLSEEKDGEIEDLKAEIDKLKGSETGGTAGGGFDPCAKVKRQLLELQGLSGKKDGEIKGLRAEIDKLKAMLKKTSSTKDSLGLQGRLDNLRRRLKIRKQREGDLGRALTRMKALRAAPSQGEFEKRLQEITATQKLIYVKRINRLYRTKQAQMFSVKSKQGGATVFPPASLSDLLRQDGPPIKEISDRWFATQWDELHDQVAMLCQINYCARSDHLQYNYLGSAANDELLSYYLRDTVVSEHAMHDRINSIDEIHGFTYRTKVAMAIVFRILVEEIFNPIRFLLNIQFPDSTRWKTKLQFRQAFEQLDNRRFLLPGTKRGFQEKESWCTRTEAATGNEYRPRRQRDENFNYFRQIEERDYDRNIGGKMTHRLGFLSLLH